MLLLSWISSLIYGLRLPLEAGALILRKPRLLLWSSFPITLTLALYYFLIRFVESWAKAQIQGWIHIPGLSGFVALLTEILLFLLSAITFSFTASLLAIPFNDVLAEKAERYSSPPLEEIKNTWPVRIRHVLVDLVKTTFSTLAMVAFLLVSWVPVVNIVSFALSFLLMAFQYISFPQTRRGEGLFAALAFLIRNFFSCLGFGTAISALFAIPVLSCLALPLAVVGGTLLYARAQGDPSLR